MTRAARRWTDPELDRVAGYVRAHSGSPAALHRVIANGSDGLRRVAAMVGRTEYAAHLVAVQIALVAGLRPAESTAGWFVRGAKDSLDSRCRAAWDRSRPETAADIARRLGFGDILGAAE